MSRKMIVGAMGSVMRSSILCGKMTPLVEAIELHKEP
jgi:hypothetical protein